MRSSLLCRVKRSSVPLLAAVVLPVLCALPIRGQITTNTALPVATGAGIIRIQSKLVRSTGDPTPTGRTLSVLAFPMVGVYGATPRLALFGVVPIVDKTLEVMKPGGLSSRRAGGLGDIRFFTRYTAYQHNRPGVTIRFAPFAGVELPTGDHRKSDALGRLPRPLQPGSGSWDPLAGAVFTWQTLRWQLDTSASYKLNTESADFRFGDLARLDVAYKFRVLPARLTPGVPSFLYIVLETNLVRQDQNEVNGDVDTDSGGTIWYLAPGLQYVTTRIILEAAVQLPAIQELNGTALENDFILTVSARFGV